MPESELQLLYQSPWFPLAFAAGVLGIYFSLPVVSGWRQLAQRFPARPAAAGERFRFASAKMGRYAWFPVSYGGVLDVRVTADGIALSVCQPFRLLCADFFLPWSEVLSVKERVAFLSRRMVVTIRESPVEIAFRGPVGGAIAASFASTQGEPGGGPADA